MNLDIVELRERFETVINKHSDLIGTESKNLIVEHAIQSPEKTRESLQRIENENRLLQIGIIGRVKAGKSSLLNALLFNGESILPKAATPMTAALTVISYGEVLSAEVEFFSHDDIFNIKAEHSKYEQQLAALTQQKFDALKERKQNKKRPGMLHKVPQPKESSTPEEITAFRDKAARQAKRELKSEISLSSAHDQFNRIRASGIDYTTIEASRNLVAGSMAELSEMLLEYVGADGQHMPFTKSVHIKLPQEDLKNIQIVDTPGVNDPVQSREERTRELLKFCDVVLIVSPSGQFLSKEDIDLMDRITAKEGVRELYVVASQVDLQLFGSVKEDSEGDLHRAFGAINSDLAEHLHSSLSTLKLNNPEVGTTYDQLIEQSCTKVIHSSGICQTIRNTFDQKGSWDEGTKKAWSNLTSNYPDYFSDTDKTLSVASLDLLANISSIVRIIDEVKAKKEAILSRRKADYIKAKSEALSQYKSALINHISTQIQEINNGDIEELKVRQIMINKIKEKVSVVLDEEYYDLVDELEINVKTKLSSTLNGYFKETKSKVEGAEGSETESYEVDNGCGFLGWRSISGNRYSTRTRTYTTVRTGAIKSALETLTCDIESTVDIRSKELVQQWKKSIYSQLLRVLRDNVDDNDLEPQQIRKVIRHVLNQVPYPDIEYSGRLPANISATGTLTGSSAETYLDNAQGYIATLRTRVKGDINAYLATLSITLKNLHLSESLFSNYNSMLEALESQIKNKAVTLDRFDRLSKELEKIN